MSINNMRSLDTEVFLEEYYINYIEDVLTTVNYPQNKFLFNSISRPYRLNHHFYRKPTVVLGEFKIFKKTNLVSHNAYSIDKFPNWSIIETFFEVYYNQKLEGVFKSEAFKKVLSVLQYTLGNTSTYYQTRWLRPKDKFISYKSDITTSYESIRESHSTIFLNSALNRYHLRKRFSKSTLAYSVYNYKPLRYFLESDIMILEYLRTTRPEWYIRDVTFFNEHQWYTEPWYTEKHYYGFKDIKFLRWNLLRLHHFQNFSYLNSCPSYLLASLYFWWLKESIFKKETIKLPQLDSFNYELGSPSRASFNGPLKDTFGFSSPLVLNRNFLDATHRPNLFVNSYNYLNILQEFDVIPNERWDWEGRHFWNDNIYPFHSRFLPSRYMQPSSADRGYRWLYESWVHESLNLSFLSSYFRQFNKLDSIQSTYNRNWETDNEFYVHEDPNVELVGWSPTTLTKNFAFHSRYKSKLGKAEGTVKEAWSRNVNNSFLDQASNNYWDFYNIRWFLNKNSLIDFNSPASDSFLNFFTSDFTFLHPNHLFFNQRLTKHILSFLLELQKDLSSLIRFLSKSDNVDSSLKLKKIYFFKVILRKSMLAVNYFPPSNWAVMTLENIVEFIDLLEADDSNRSWRLRDQLLFEFASCQRFFSITILVLQESLSKDVIY